MGIIVTHASVVMRHRDRLLVVREAKEESRDRWNLPGGHVEFGETLAAAAEREAKEETGVGVFLTDLLGVYTRLGEEAVSVRFVFGAHGVTGEPEAGDEISEVRWMTTDEVRALPDAKLVSPRVFRRILDDIDAGVTFPVSVLKEVSET
jgi:ADP-ribose pyrophosphatase YjhB (NUDIX family)